MRRGDLNLFAAGTNFLAAFIKASEGDLAWVAILLGFLLLNLALVAAGRVRI